MPFLGATFNTLNTNSSVGEDISPLVYALMPKEAPLVDFLIGGQGFLPARSVKHEYFQDFMLPNYIVNSTAINSDTAVTAFQVNAGLGNALTVGTLLENESAAPEVLQVTSIVSGGNSIVVSRNYGGGGVGSLAAGQQIYVRGMAALEGQDHSGANTQRLGTRTANTVGYFNVELAASGTQLSIDVLGNDSYAAAQNKVLIDVNHQLEKEILRGVLNSTNSLGTTSATRTMKGIRSFISTVNSQVTATSFAANPHLYIGNVWEQIFQNGASPTETWCLVAGRTFFNNISNLNDTKVYDSNTTELFKRRITVYQGPFGACEVFVSRALPATELLILPKERVRPVVLRPWQMLDIARTGDNVKSAVVGEYSVEVHHESAMARLRV